MRVEVWNGDRSKHLGEGTMVGWADVYVWRDTRDGSLKSPKFAEEKPEGFPEDMFEVIEGNPKIVLDSGDTVYGCQTWWREVQPENVPE